MSLYIDLKYINFISSRLEFFKRKNDYLFNFRCPICGDSSKKKTKTRGYFYKVKNEMFMKCHNCAASYHFGTFLKMIDGTLYDQYCFDRYADGVAINKPHKKEVKLVFTEPKLIEKKPETLLDSILDRVDTLPNDHIAVQFCEKRMIPDYQYKRIYFIDDIKKIEQLSEKARDKVKTTEPRIVLPFFDQNLQLVGVTCRALGNEKLRYITIDIKEDVPMVFGVETVNINKHIYVTEGPIDSLFLPNAIAVTGTSFGKLESLGISKDNMTVIVDNQPRNKDVCKIIENLIDKDYNIVIWTQTLKEKDINEMVLAGKSRASILKLIEERTFRGLEAKANFIIWKRC